VGVDYSSRYIWRGMDLIADDNGALQPWFDAGYALTDKLSVHYLFWADYRLIDGEYDYGNDNDLNFYSPFTIEKNLLFKVC
jgi:hypothetical protein